MFTKLKINLFFFFFATAIECFDVLSIVEKNRIVTTFDLCSFDANTHMHKSMSMCFYTYTVYVCR